MRTHAAAGILVVTLAASLGAGSSDPIDRIREGDIKSDLFALAGDAMRGREAGTLDELTASAWVAERARAAGLQPAGDNGTYFQFFPIERLRISTTSTVIVDGKELTMGRDVLPDSAIVGNVDAPITVADGDKLEGLSLKDRALVVRYAPPEQPVQDASPRTVAAMRTWLRGVVQKVNGSGYAAILVLVPDAAEDQWNRVAITLPRGGYGLNPGGIGNAPVAVHGAPLLYVRESSLAGAPQSDARVVANITADKFQYPSVNIVAKVPGRDPKLKDEYVLFSAHQDHDGVRYAVNGDDIWNGADDNATTAVALLAIGALRLAWR